MSDGTPFLRVAADRIGAPGSARIAGKNAISDHQRRQLVLNGCDFRMATGFLAHTLYVDVMNQDVVYRCRFIGMS